MFLLLMWVGGGYSENPHSMSCMWHMLYMEEGNLEVQWHEQEIPS